MLQLEILVLKFLAVYGLATSSIAFGEITTLNHELLNNAVEARAFVGEWFARFADALLPSAKSSEVFGGLRNDIVVQLENDSSKLGLPNCYVEEDTASLYDVC